MKSNSYAEFLQNQGYNVILVDGVYWFEYQSFMTPAYLPHCLPEISSKNAQKALKISRRPFARWDVHWGTNQNTEWWYILKRGDWDIEQVADKKKRWMIRQGKKNFVVRPMTFSEVIALCPSVAQSAATRYKGKAEAETKEIFKKKIYAAEKSPNVLEYIGCFQKEKLVSYAENLIQENGLWIHVIRNDPFYLKEYSGYGLIDGLLNYYLNEREMGYVCDGCRNIHHKTQFQEHLVKVFGFTKEYSILKIEYAKTFSMAVKILYPLRKPLWFLAEKSEHPLIQNVAAVLRQESIRISCERFSFSAEKEASNNQAEVKIIPLASEHAREAAQLHIEGIYMGFISSLGINFVTALYKAIAESKESFGYVAIKDCKVVGFATFTSDVNKLYKSIILTSGIKFFFLLLQKMFSRNVIRKIFETLFYPKRIERLQLPKAELLSIAVSPDDRGYGLASRFVKTGFKECARRGIKELKTLAAVKIGPINKMYEKFGFKVKTQVENHGIMSNVYVVPTDYFENS